MAKDLILSGLQIHAESANIDNGRIVIRDGKIHAIDLATAASSDFQFPPNFHLLPGFIDLHVHGAEGSDVMDATPEAFTTISQSLAKEGTTAFLATTMTAEVKHLERVLCTARDFMRHPPSLVGADLLGVHLEGPFISPKKVGAQRIDYLQRPDIALFNHWQTLSDAVIKLVTLAPELPGSEALIQALVQQHIVVSMGHTDATYAETMTAIQSGCRHATHLFNAMRGIHQREPGAVGAILLSDQVTAELIVDGEHLHPAIVNLALQLKGFEKLILVTDAMRAKCLSAGCYDLGGQAVYVNHQRATLADGTLAGSVLTMNQAIKNFIAFTHCTLNEVMKMVAENPAKILGIFSRKGSIAVGKDADLVVLDDQFNVKMVVCGGAAVGNAIFSND